MADADHDLIEEIGPYTKSGPERLEAMIEAVRQVDREGLAGDIVECGVWRGGNIILARKLSPERVCWLYDTFTGMTEPGEFDTKKSGAKAIKSYRKKLARGERWAAVSLEDVRANFAETETLNDNYLRFIEGPVEETLRDHRNLPEKIALLRLDTDWHESTKVELKVLYPRLVPGGILIIDDYGHWEGARKAVDDYFAGGGPEMFRIDYTAVVMRKPC